MTEETIVERMADVMDFLAGVIFDAETPEAMREKSRLPLAQQRKYTAWVNEMKHLRQSTRKLQTNCENKGIG